MTRSGLRPLSVGEILDASFTLYREHFGTLVVVAAACQAVGLAADVLLPPVLASLVGMVGGTVGFAGLTWMAAEIALGRAVTPREAISFGLNNFLRIGAGLLCMFLVVALASLLALFVVVGLTSLALSASKEVGIATGVISGAGGLAGISYVLVRYFAVYQVVALERERHFLKRSALLARGAFGKIGTVWGVSFLIVSLPSMVIGFGIGMRNAAAQGDVGFQDTVAMIDVLMPVGIWLIGSLTSPFSAALGVMLYLDQRVRKDGLDVQMAVTGLEVRAGDQSLAA